jgi:hypothetical protein
MGKRYTYNRTYQRLTSAPIHMPDRNVAIIALQAEQTERLYGADGLRRFWQELERVNGLVPGTLTNDEPSAAQEAQ